MKALTTLKALRQPWDHWRPWIARLVLVALLLVVTGCDDDGLDENGNPLPELAKYQVTLDRETVHLTPQIPTAQIQLKVACVGEKLPPGCATFNPNWTASGFAAFNNLAVNIANPALPETTATLSYSDFASIPNTETALGSDAAHFLYFSPTRVPDKMELTGKQTVAVKISLTIFSPNETEETLRNPPEKAGTPSVVLPPSFIISSPGTVGSLKVIYKGPPTQLAGVGVDGGNADKFSVGVATGLPMEKTFSFNVAVTYTGPVTGGYYYTTTLFVTTKNGAVGRATIIAQN